LYVTYKRAMVANEHHKQRLALEVRQRNSFPADIRQLEIDRRRAERQHGGIDCDHERNVERVYALVEPIEV